MSNNYHKKYKELEAKIAVLEKENELKRLNKELDHKVVQRTQELTATNNDLRIQIRERREAEEALRKQFHRTEQILQTTMDGYILADTDGKLLDVNPAYCEMIGYSREELLKMNIRDLEVKLSPTEIEKRIERMVKQGRDRFETKHKCKDGRIIDLDVSIVIMQSDETPLVAAFVRDITERMNAEEKLLRLNRALRMLSECNQTLVRAQEESKFLKDICRHIVKIGGYRLAWVGFADQDRKKIVRPVAQAGFEEGYLDTVKITWAETNQGRGPTGTAIRTGKPSVCKNILTDPAYAPWRKEAIQRGYASSIALPLISNQQPFGALNLYSTEPDAFDSEELKMLAELANDVAYGITTLRIRIKQKQAEEALHGSEERYRTLFEAAGDAIFILKNDTFIDCNQKTLQLFQCTRDQIIGHTPYEFSPDMQSDGKDSTKKALEKIKAVLNGEPQFFEWTHTRYDGTSFEAEVQLNLVELSHVVYIQAIVRNITERKQAEEALKQSVDELTALNALSQQLSVSLPLGRVVQAALDGMIAAISPDLALLFLREGDKLFLKNFGPKSHKITFEDLPVHRAGECLCGLVVKEGKPIYSLNIQKDPRCTWEECKKAGIVSFTSIPIFSGDNILGVIGLASNTERDFRKQAEFLETLSNEIATSLQNALLFQQVQQHATELESQIKEREKAEVALRKSTERLQALSHRLLEVQETERRFIARELHDEIGQTLTAVKINLQTVPQSVDAEPVEKHLEASINMISCCLQQVRNLSLDLRPSILDDLGLVPAIRWYVDRLTHRTGMQVDFTADESITRLQPELEIACFRVAQEALTNAVRHARATIIQVKLQKIKQELHLEVSDNGRGFEVQTARQLALAGKSLGLLGMEERVMLAGGTLEIRSSQKKGAEIHARFPFREMNSNRNNNFQEF